MGALMEMYKTDTQLESAGVWLQYGETDDGKPIRIRVARAGGSNKRYNKALQAAIRPVQRLVATGNMPIERSTTIVQGVFSRHVILEWENVDIEDEADVPFTPENAMRLFTVLPGIWEDIQEQASSSAIFRDVVREEVLGN